MGEINDEKKDENTDYYLLEVKQAEMEHNGKNDRVNGDVNGSVEDKGSPLWIEALMDNPTDLLIELFFTGQLYFSGCLHVWDTAFDLCVIAKWIEQDVNIWLITASILFIVIYRTISSIAIGKQFGWVSGVLQWLDVQVFFEIYRSSLNPRSKYTRELNWIRRMEAIFESSPQAILQLGYLLIISVTQRLDILVLISIVLSLCSIGFSVSKADEIYFHEKAQGYFKIFKSKKLRKCINGCKSICNPHKKKMQKKMVVHFHTKKKTVKSIKRTAKCCTLNWKYFFRFFFRIIEGSGRVFILALLWYAFGVIVCMSIIGIELFLYGLLQITGVIGYEIGNWVALLIVHPNLSLSKDTFDDTNYPMLLKVTSAVNGWYGLFLVFRRKLDTIYVHFIHRFIESVVELSLLIGLNYDKIVNNTFVLIIYVFSCIFTVVTPAMVPIIKKLLKEENYLENNVFGLIRANNTRILKEFLNKSKRSNELVKARSPDGHTPLSLAGMLTILPYIKPILRNENI